MAPRTYDELLHNALQRRHAVVRDPRIEAYRLLSGPFEDLPGVFVDVYGPAAVIMTYQGETPHGLEVDALAETVLERMKLDAVYLKRFVRDRSRLGGQFEAQLRDPEPMLGTSVPEAITIREGDLSLEVCMYDGFSTGLFLDQRDNRAALAEYVADRAEPARVLNLFAYTCAFGAACARVGAQTTNVDVSKRYLDWGQRNYQLCGVDPAEHEFRRMDAIEFLSYAKRKGLRYEMVILDPPSFASGKKGRSFSAVRDYGTLAQSAADVLTSDGLLYCSTNAGRLATNRGRGLDDLLGRSLDKQWQTRALPRPPLDFRMERDRLACRLFGLPTSTTSARTFRRSH
jgi:23S rRNA (cytosine1962-C5)-methyltransferase